MVKLSDIFNAVSVLANLPQQLTALTQKVDALTVKVNDLPASPQMAQDVTAIKQIVSDTQQAVINLAIVLD